MDRPPLGTVPKFILDERRAKEIITLYVYNPETINLHALVNRMYDNGITEFIIKKPEE